MNKDQKIEEIRRACIAVNPSIREEYGRCMSCGYGIEFCKHLKNCPLTYSDREIRLSDVLLAIKGVYYVNTDGYFFKEIDHFPLGNWNLLKDSLESQSEECISFIHELIQK